MDLSPGTLISPVSAPVRAEPRLPTVAEVEGEGANGMLAKGMVADDVVSNDYGAGSVIAPVLDPLAVVPHGAAARLGDWHTFFARGRFYF